MTRTLLVSGTVLILALAGGCKDNATSSSAPATATATTPAAPASTTATATATAPPLGTSGKMAHCPTVVGGAKTDVADVDKGVALTVTASDPAAVADIRARAKALVDDSKNASVGKHTGGGGGGGIYGRCPVILRDVTLAAADVDNGSKLTVVPKNAAELTWLRRETRDRVARLAQGQSLGEQKMAHCPSSVDGATTTVTSTTDGVTLLVTAKTDDATNEIRSRAQHAATISRAPQTGTAHNGGGTGGSALGRCPVVLKGANVDVKDIPGGAQITLKAKTTADVPGLQSEAKERALKFQAVDAR